MGICQEGLDKFCLGGLAPLGGIHAIFFTYFCPIAQPRQIVKLFLVLKIGDTTRRENKLAKLHKLPLDFDQGKQEREGCRMLEIIARVFLWLTAGAFGLAGLVLIGYVVLSWLGVGENEN